MLYHCLLFIQCVIDYLSCYHSLCFRFNIAWETSWCTKFNGPPTIPGSPMKPPMRSNNNWLQGVYLMFIVIIWQHDIDVENQVIYSYRSCYFPRKNPPFIVCLIIFHIFPHPKGNPWVFPYFFQGQPLGFSSQVAAAWESEVNWSHLASGDVMRDSVRRRFIYLYI